MAWHIKDNIRDSSLERYVGNVRLQPVLYVDPTARDLDVDYRDPRLGIPTDMVFNRRIFRVDILLGAHIYDLQVLVNSGELDELLDRIATGYTCIAHRGHLTGEAWAALQDLRMKVDGLAPSSPAMHGPF